MLGVITPVPKVGRDSSAASNTRPITVTSTWYRVYALMILSRLSAYEAQLFDPLQHGFCKGRDAMTAVGALSLAIDRARFKRQSLHLLKLDIRKAYDSVNREALIAVLKAKGFPTYIRDLLTSGFNAESALRESNHTLTERFTTTVGIRQGCPLSPFLFNVLIADVLPLLRGTMR
jgi:Reverse transcriptase (RNA-dependent DNA polymerase)